jgi:hypothetical protein
VVRFTGYSVVVGIEFRPIARIGTIKGGRTSRSSFCTTRVVDGAFVGLRSAPLERNRIVGAVCGEIAQS